MLEVKMFGTFKIFKDDKLIDNSFGSHKAEELFKFLLLNKNKNRIYILFRGVELPKENKDAIVDKLSKFTEKVTENFKILKFE